jgi:ubiquinone biosynthesis protein UbiJ
MLTERLQHLVDAQVEGSPRARELLSQLEGRRMRVVVRHSPWEVTAHAEGGRLQLRRGDPAEADVTLSGTPLSMLALLRADDPAAMIRRGDVSLTGDAEAGARFQELAVLLRPDIEAGLARVIGDVPAFGIGSLVRKALDFGRSSVNTQAANVGEYLAHEKRLLVPEAEGRQFIEGVDMLREHVDRLEARIAALESRGNAA